MRDEEMKNPDYGSLQVCYHSVSPFHLVFPRWYLYHACTHVHLVCVILVCFTSNTCTCVNYSSLCGVGIFREPCMWLVKNDGVLEACLILKSFKKL